MKNAFILVRALCLSAFLFSSLANAASSPQIYKINSILQGSHIELMSGHTLDLGVTPSANENVIFKDLKPGANWGHPAQIEIVSQAGKTLRTYPTRLPPKNLSAALQFRDGSFAPKKDEPITFKINDFGGKFKTANAAHLYAVMINGSADQRHYNDFAFLYRVLVHVYGYLPSHIFVADSAFIKTAPDLGGDGSNAIQYESTYDSVTALMKKLAGQLTSDDQLLLATDDHGDLQNGESTLYLYDKEMPVSVFAPLLTAIKSTRVVSIHEPCYAGGFVRPSVAEQRIAMSASTNLEESWASEDGNFDEFIYHVISAFAMQTFDGKAVASDTNNDGKISAREAFAWAVTHDQEKERPVLEDSPDSGFADTIGISF